MKSYRVFGLRLKSDFELPELRAAAESVADVSVRLGQIESTTVEDGVHSSGDRLLLVVAGIGRYLISTDEIIVEQAPEAPERNVRLYLLGSAFGALLHLRGLLPLHANAVGLDGKAIAFMGRSGSGKSTLAAWFSKNGFQIFTDDVCVVEVADDHAVVWPGLPRLRLWQDALNAIGQDVHSLERSYVGDESYDKFDLPLDDEKLARRSADLQAIFLLVSGDSFNIRRLQGIEAIEALFANTYRGAFITQAASRVAHWSAAMKLAAGTPVFEVVRELGLDKIDQQYGRLAHHCQRYFGGQASVNDAA